VWIRRTDWRDPARKASRRNSGGFSCAPEVSHQMRWFHNPTIMALGRALRDANDRAILELLHIDPERPV
jgi:hypothetical protein